MRLLIKNALIIHPGSKHHRETTHLYINSGRIEAIGQGIQVKGSESLDVHGACVSPGWLDIGTLNGDPGYEHREDFNSAERAAAAGGFTGLACFPNTSPAIHSKSEVLYIKNNSKDRLVEFFPIGAISQNCSGKDITEMYDMQAAGAVAFSDGKKPVQDTGLMMRALQYVQPFDGVVINQPTDVTIAPGGQMHEGIVSTSLGLRGIPSLAEEVMVQRDIYLAEYTASRLHIHNVSSAGAVQLIREAKARGVKITCSVAAMNLACDDSALLEFDSNFKVQPPIRESADFEALRQGLADGVIDCITSNHTPLDEESKNLEFTFAEFGATGLETAFALSHTHLSKMLPFDELVNKWAIAPRQILKLPVPDIEKGATVNLTIFDPGEDWSFSQGDIQSKSRNTPFLGWKFKGRVLAVIRGNKAYVRSKAQFA